MTAAHHSYSVARPALAKARADIDRGVNRCYRNEPFPSDNVEFPFQLYEQLTSLLRPAPSPKENKKSHRISDKREKPLPFAVWLKTELTKTLAATFLLKSSKSSADPFQRQRR